MSSTDRDPPPHTPRSQADAPERDTVDSALEEFFERIGSLAGSRPKDGPVAQREYIAKGLWAAMDLVMALCHAHQAKADAQQPHACRNGDQPARRFPPGDLKWSRRVPIPMGLIGFVSFWEWRGDLGAHFGPGRCGQNRHEQRQPEDEHTGGRENAVANGSRPPPQDGDEAQRCA